MELITNSLQRMNEQRDWLPSELNLNGKSPRLTAPEVCPTCRFPAGELGLIGYDVPVGHPNFGKLQRCPACYERNRQARAERTSKVISRLNGIEGWLNKARFETYRVTDQNKPAYDAAVEFARDPRGLLTLWGDFGPGKTHLLASIYHHLNDKGRAALYCTMPDLVSYHREIVGKGNSEEFYQHVSLFSVLLIDEIDKASLKEWTREQAYRLFNRRYNNAGSMGTVMAMNRDPRLADEDMGYLFSRIQQDTFKCVHLAGDNRGKVSLIQKLVAKLSA